MSELEKLAIEWVKARQELFKALDDHSMWLESKKSGKEVIQPTPLEEHFKNLGNAEHALSNFIKKKQPK